MKFAPLLLLALITTPALAGDAQLTRQILMQGCTIPEKRDFPLGPPELACENFNDYVCGKLSSSFVIPADRSYWNFSLIDARERLLYAKKRYFSLLQKGFSPRTPRAAQLKDVYLSCMNLGARKIEVVAHLKQEVAKLDEVKTREQLLDYLANSYTNPDFGFIEADTSPNQKDPLVYDLLLSGASLSMPEKSYYEEAEPVADLQILATSFFKTAGLDQPEQRALWLVEFEKAYGKASPSRADMNGRPADDTYRDRDFFLKTYPNLRLEKLFARVPQHTPLRDFQPELLGFFNEALGKEPIEKLKSVVLFHTLNRFHPTNTGSDLDVAFPAYFDSFYKFAIKHHGLSKKRAPLDERCTKRVMEDFKMELDAELLPVLFPDFPTKKVHETVDKVRQAILAGLQKNEWLSESAKVEAIKKISVATLQLVAPEKEKDWRFLPVAKYSPKNYIANLRKVNQLKVNRTFEEIKTKRDRNAWFMGPLTVNAAYVREDNRFVLPIAILQPPVFDPRGTDVQNLGGIGIVVGHELGHGIDDVGARYDSEGKVRDWMTEADHENFAMRSKSFVELYDSFGHNGKLTLGENIGDHVGVTFAYSAAFPTEGASTEEVQEFYKSFARTWCTVMRPEIEKVLLKSDPHSMGWARINGQVMQQEGFLNAFGCKPGNKMFQEKEKRIRVW